MRNPKCRHTSTTEQDSVGLLAHHKCDTCGRHLLRREGAAFGPRPGEIAWEVTSKALATEEIEAASFDAETL